MSWLMNDKVAQRYPFVKESISFPLQLLWQTKINKPVFGQPLITKEFIYVQSMSHVFALHLQTGEIVWQSSITVEDEWSSNKGTPVIVDDRLFFADFLGRVYAVDRFTGDLLWQRDDLKASDEYICAYNDQLFLRTKKRDATTGQRQLGYVCLNLQGETQWLSPQGMIFTVQTAVWQNTLIFGTRDKKLFGVDVDTGDIRWQFDLTVHEDEFELSGEQYGLSTALKISNGIVVVQIGYRFIGIDAQSGTFRWFHTASTLAANLAGDEHYWYYLTLNDEFCGFDAKTGDLIFNYPKNKLGTLSGLGYSGLIVEHYYIVGLDSSQKIVALDTQNGDLVWEYQGNHPFANGASFSENKLLICDAVGNIYCFESK